MKLNGVYVAAVTPFTLHGELDKPGFERLLSWFLDSGVDGIVPCGTTGESAALSLEEWSELVAIAVKLAKPRGKQIVAGCGSNNTDTSLRAMEAAAKLGCDAALVVTPYYNKPTQPGLIAHYEYLADRSLLPLVLYNVPGRTGVSLSLETVKHLLQHKNIIGIKEASGNYAQWLGLAAGLDWSAKSLLAGDDDAFAPLLALGGSGIISASANVAPQAFVAMYRKAAEGDYQAVFALQKKLLPLTRAMFLETNPAPAKYALSRMGKLTEALRLPLVAVTPPVRAVIDEALKGLELVQ